MPLRPKTLTVAENCEHTASKVDLAVPWAQLPLLAFEKRILLINPNATRPYSNHTTALQNCSKCKYVIVVGLI